MNVDGFLMRLLNRRIFLIADDGGSRVSVLRLASSAAHLLRRLDEHERVKIYSEMAQSWPFAPCFKLLAHTIFQATRACCSPYSPPFASSASATLHPLAACPTLRPASPPSRLLDY